MKVWDSFVNRYLSAYHVPNMKYFGYRYLTKHVYVWESELVLLALPKPHHWRQDRQTEVWDGQCGRALGFSGLFFPRVGKAGTRLHLAQRWDDFTETVALTHHAKSTPYCCCWGRFPVLKKQPRGRAQRPSSHHLSGWTVSSPGPRLIVQGALSF